MISFRLFVDIWNQLNKRTTPQHQLRVCDWAETTLNFAKRLLQLPRYGIKSETLCLYVAWRLACNKNLCFLVISATEELASQNLYLIRTVIETHPLCKGLIGNKQTWTSSKLYVKRAKKVRDPSVQCVPITAITGKHGDEIIADDLEIPRTCETETAREKLWKIVGELSNVGHRVLFTGTPHTADSIYLKLKDLVDSVLCIKWKDDDGKVFWENHPETFTRPDGTTYRKFTDEWAEEQKKIWTENYFLSQMQLVPRDIADTVLDPTMVRHYSDEVSAREIFGATDADNVFVTTIDGQEITGYSVYWDVARGLEGKDSSVLAIVYKSALDGIFVERTTPLPPVTPEEGYRDQCRKIVELCRKYQLGKVHVEESGASTYAAELRRTAAEMGVMLSVKEVTRSRNKQRFIAETLEPTLKAGRLYLSTRAAEEGKFMAQLGEFPRAKHDDFIDAAAGAVWMLGKDGGGINYDKTKSIENRVYSSTPIAFNTYRPLRQSR